MIKLAGLYMLDYHLCSKVTKSYKKFMGSLKSLREKEAKILLNPRRCPLSHTRTRRFYDWRILLKRRIVMQYATTIGAVLSKSYTGSISEAASARPSHTALPIKPVCRMG